MQQQLHHVLDTVILAVTTSAIATPTPAVRMTVKASGVINMSGMPTSSAGLSSGDLWNNSGVVNIVP